MKLIINVFTVCCMLFGILIGIQSGINDNASILIISIFAFTDGIVMYMVGFGLYEYAKTKGIID